MRLRACLCPEYAISRRMSAEPSISCSHTSLTIVVQLRQCAAEEEVKGAEALTDHINRLESSLEEEHSELERVGAESEEALATARAELADANAAHASKVQELEAAHAAAIGALEQLAKERQVGAPVTTCDCGCDCRNLRLV